METARHASSRIDELTIGASAAELRRASEWLDGICLQRNVPPTATERLAICLHEVLANVLAHGGASAHAAPIALALALEVGPDAGHMQAGVAVSDAGMAFNPLTVPQKARPRTLDEALPGGLGLVMIRRCADWLDYRHEGGRNHFTFGVRWKSR